MYAQMLLYKEEESKFVFPFYLWDDPTMENNFCKVWIELLLTFFIFHKFYAFSRKKECKETTGNLL